MSKPLQAMAEPAEDVGVVLEHAVTHDYAYKEEFDALSWTEFNAQCQAAVGLKKLQFIKDPRLRSQLYRLWFVCAQNSRNPDMIAELERQAVAERERRFRSLAFRALHGKLGRTDDEREAARQVAERLMPIGPGTGRRQEDPSMMRRLATALKELRDEFNIDPAGGFDQMEMA